MSIKSYKEMRVWGTAMELAVASYKLTDSLPEAEELGLTSQIRTAAAAIPSGIAIAHGREVHEEFVQACRDTQSAARELETYVLLAEKLGHVQYEETKELVATADQVVRMLGGMIRNAQERNS